MSCAARAPPKTASEGAWQRAGQGVHAALPLYPASGVVRLRLRSQLSRTPEWVSRAERERTAATLQLPQDARLAGALRERRSAALNKALLLRLCRLWRFASDIWAPRKDRPCTRRTAGAALALAAPSAPAPTLVRSSLTKLLVSFSAD